MAERKGESAPTMRCFHCGLPITEEYAGTFWKAPDPMPVVWVHASGDRSCSYATPRTSPGQAGAAS